MNTFTRALKLQDMSEGSQSHAAASDAESSLTLLTLLLLAQTAILWHLGSELGRVQPEKLVDAIKRAREGESARAVNAAHSRVAAGADVGTRNRTSAKQELSSDGWGRWLRCFQG